MNAVYLGVLLGLTITVSFGPGFMALFQTSILQGVTRGYVLATGMLLSDVVLVCISYFGLARVIFRWDTVIMGSIAGSIIILTGLISLMRNPAPINVAIESQGPKNGFVSMLFKGFLLNIANPFSLVFWIGIVGFAAKNWGPDDHRVALFFTGVFLTAFTSDLLKCYLSGILRNILQYNTIRWINRIVAILLMGIGLYLILKVSLFP